MNIDVNGFISSLEDSTKQVQQSFGSLTKEQLNWKPFAYKWSVGECIDHLVTSNRLYFPQLEKITTGGHKNSLWQKVSPFSGFFGKVLKKSVSPDAVKKMKTAGVFEPAKSDEELSIITDFVKMNEKFSSYIKKLDGVNLKKTKITSPVSKFITYSLLDALVILTTHEQRHINQSKKVMETEGFPK